VADLADAELLLPLTKFLTADSCAAVPTTGTLGTSLTINNYLEEASLI
jgi:hypothetical protein